MLVKIVILVTEAIYRLIEIIVFSFLYHIPIAYNLGYLAADRLIILYAYNVTLKFKILHVERMYIICLIFAQLYIVCLVTFFGGHVSYLDLTFYPSPISDCRRSGV